MMQSPVVAIELAKFVSIQFINYVGNYKQAAATGLQHDCYMFGVRLMFDTSDIYDNSKELLAKSSAQYSHVYEVDNNPTHPPSISIPIRRKPEYTEKIRTCDRALALTLSR